MVQPIQIDPPHPSPLQKAVVLSDSHEDLVLRLIFALWDTNQRKKVHGILRVLGFLLFTQYL